MFSLTLHNILRGSCERNFAKARDSILGRAANCSVSWFWFIRFKFNRAAQATNVCDISAPLHQSSHLRLLVPQCTATAFLHNSNFHVNDYSDISRVDHSRRAWIDLSQKRALEWKKWWHKEKCLRWEVELHYLINLKLIHSFPYSIQRQPTLRLVSVTFCLSAFVQFLSPLQIKICCSWDFHFDLIHNEFCHLLRSLVVCWRQLMAGWLGKAILRSASASKKCQNFTLGVSASAFASRARAERDIVRDALSDCTEIEMNFNQLTHQREWDLRSLKQSLVMTKGFPLVAAAVDDRLASLVQS